MAILLVRMFLLCSYTFCTLYGFLQEEVLETKIFRRRFNLQFLQKRTNLHVSVQHTNAQKVNIFEVRAQISSFLKF